MRTHRGRSRRQCKQTRCYKPYQRIHSHRCSTAGLPCRTPRTLQGSRSSRRPLELSTRAAALQLPPGTFPQRRRTIGWCSRPCPPHRSLQAPPHQAAHRRTAFKWGLHLSLSHCHDNQIASLRGMYCVQQRCWDTDYSLRYHCVWGSRLNRSGIYPQCNRARARCWLAGYSVPFL